MTPTDRLLEWLEMRGHSKQAVRQLLMFVQVPDRPDALVRVLERFVSATDVVIQTVTYTDQDTLVGFRDLAERVAGDLKTDSTPYPPVHASESRRQGLYTHRPLYGLLQRGHSREEDRLEEYLWLVGVMVLLRPSVPDAGGPKSRYAKWAMAVRAMGEPGTPDDELLPPGHLLEHLDAVIKGVADPGDALERMYAAARSSRRREHVRYLRAAWSFLMSPRPPVKAGTGTGVGGYRPIRGLPSGIYAHFAPARPEPELVEESGFSDWGTLERLQDQLEHDGNSRAGEAPADAGSPGDLQWPARTSDFALAYYSRAAAYRSARQRQTRAANSGQDTLVTATVWTPAETASIIHSLFEIHHDAPRGSAERAGAALCLLGMVTGIGRNRIVALTVVARVADIAKSNAKCALTTSGRLVWHSEAASRLPPPSNEVRHQVHEAVPWVSVPIPGMLRDIEHTLRDCASGKVKPSQSITVALRQLNRRAGRRIYWSQIRRHWWGWLAATCGRPSVATMITGVIRPSTATSKHYMHLSPAIQDATYRETYQRFQSALHAEYEHNGWPWPGHWRRCAATAPHENGCGSPIVPRPEALEETYQTLIARVARDANGHQAAADQLTLLLYHVITLITGLRAVRLRAGHAALIARGYAAISDKDTRGFRKARLVKMSPQVSDRIRRWWYRRQRHLLEAGLLSSGLRDLPALPPDRTTFLELLELAPRASLAFVGGDTGTSLELLTPSEIRSDRRLDFRLPCNWQRHWLRTKLLDQGVSDQAADAWMGHACIGQDPWGSTSMMRVGETVEGTGIELESTIMGLLRRMERSYERVCK